MITFSGSAYPLKDLRCLLMRILFIIFYGISDWLPHEQPDGNSGSPGFFASIIDMKTALFCFPYIKINSYLFKYIKYYKNMFKC